MKRVIGLLKINYSVRKTRIINLRKRIWGIFTRSYNQISEEEFFAY